MRHECESLEFEDDGGYLGDSSTKRSGSPARLVAVRESFLFS
jgi:hypothetical protein